MPEMHLRLAGFTYGACRPFTKSKERIYKFKEKGDSIYIYQNGLDKECFQYDTAYGDLEDLTRRTASKYYLIKHLILLRIQNMIDNKKVLLDWFTIFWIKNSLYLLINLPLLLKQKQKSILI